MTHGAMGNDLTRLTNQKSVISHVIGINLGN